jgi:hypothetical protein
MPANPALGIGRTKTNKKRKRPRKQNADAVAIERSKRLQHWLDLRIQGFTFQQIGDSETPKVSAQRVAKVITAHLQSITIAPAEELKKLQDMRLDALFLGASERAMSGDGWSIDRALAILDRKAQLHGLNAPVKTQVEEVGAVATAKVSLLSKLDDMARKVSQSQPVTIDATPVAEIAHDPDTPQEG